MIDLSPIPLSYREEGLARLAELDEDVERMGDPATGVTGDVTDLADLDRLCAAVNDDRRRIDALFVDLAASRGVALCGACQLEQRAVQHSAEGREGANDVGEHPYRDLRTDRQGQLGNPLLSPIPTAVAPMSISRAGSATSRTQPSWTPSVTDRAVSAISAWAATGSIPASGARLGVTDCNYARVVYTVRGMAW
jgi:hypothetical protein